MIYQEGAKVIIKKGVLKGQIGIIAPNSHKGLYFIYRDTDHNFSYPYGPFLEQDLELITVSNIPLLDA